MEEYELLLRDSHGGIVLLYAMNCANDRQARANLQLFQRVRYSHFEIWRDDSLICEGPRLSIASAA